MFSFIRFVVVIVFLQSNRNLTKTEVCTWDWVIAVIGRPCFGLEECGLWEFGLEKQ